MWKSHVRNEFRTRHFVKKLPLFLAANRHSLFLSHELCVVSAHDKLKSKLFCGWADFHSTSLIRSIIEKVITCSKQRQIEILPIFLFPSLWLLLCFSIFFSVSFSSAYYCSPHSSLDCSTFFGHVTRRLLQVFPSPLLLFCFVEHLITMLH